MKIIENALSKYGNITLEVPKESKLGDYAFPCFSLAKKMKKNPVEIAKQISSEISIKGVKVIANGPYLNFFVNSEIIVKQAFSKKKIKKKGTIVIDYSAPNVAKHMGIHNLRSTVIGQALYNMHKYLGYKVIGINHLGDWGTNFGQLIVGIKKFGKLSNIKNVQDLNKIYVKFHEIADEVMMQKARDEFTKLESGDKEALRYWKKFVKVSLEDYNRIYKRLGVKFDSTKGESEYFEHLNYALEKIKKFTKTSDGALVVDVGLDAPLLLKKKDGSSLYGLRDIAAGIYRMEKYHPNKILYVVDVAQSFHFKQWFVVMEKLGFKDIFEHVSFGRLNFKDGAMSTRKGKVVILEDVLDKARDKVLEIINEKNPTLKNKNKVAEIVGVGAVVFNDLVNDRVHNIIFDWNKVLDFQGETGPYVQYTYARANSILKKSQKKKLKVDFSDLEDVELDLIKIVGKFEDVVLDSVSKYKPHILARYLIELCQKFNEFYHKCPVHNSDFQDRRLVIIEKVMEKIKQGLNLLNISTVEEM